MDYQCTQICSYTLVYDLLHNSRHYIHTLQDRDQCICFSHKQASIYNLSQLNILVYNLDKDHRNGQVNMCMNRHFLARYIRHLHHMATVHMDLNILPSAELKLLINNIKQLTSKLQPPLKHSLIRSVS